MEEIDFQLHVFQNFNLHNFYINIFAFLLKKVVEPGSKTIQ